MSEPSSRRAACLGAAAILAAAAPCAAQLQLDVQAGHLEYEAGPAATSTDLAAALRYRTEDGGYGVSAGLPFQSGQPYWAAVDASQAFTTGDAVQVGLELGGSAFGYRITRDASQPVLPGLTTRTATGWGATGAAMPLLRLNVGPLAAELRSGGAWYHGSLGGNTADRGVWLSDASLRFAPTPAVSLGVDGRYVDAPEGGFPYAGVTAAVASNRLALWGSVGQWFDDRIDTTPWSAGALVPIVDRASIILTGRRDAFDPVYGTPARTLWGVGLRLALGDDGGLGAPAPVPDFDDDGRARIRLDASDADGAPLVAGDFNDWKPAPMTRDGGDWTFAVALEPGVYRYSFVDADGEFFVPEGTPGRRPDGFGGWVAVLVVE